MPHVAPWAPLGRNPGKMVWNWRLFTTPDRPYSTSTTTATNANSFNPIMIASFLEVDRSPAALLMVESASYAGNAASRPAMRRHDPRQWYDTSLRTTNEASGNTVGIRRMEGGADRSAPTAAKASRQGRRGADYSTSIVTPRPLLSNEFRPRSRGL